MRASGQAEPLARFAGGGCIILSVLGYTLFLAYAPLIIAVLVAVFLIMGVILRAMIDQTVDRECRRFTVGGGRLSPRWAIPCLG